MVAQSDDTVLMTVDDQEVTVGEFRYIYEKNNGEGADYSRMSVNEYLDLYTKFKLKVAEAKSMGLDTVEVLNKELDGYRKQLADSYIMDKEVVKTLVKELHERKQQDVRLSHILLSTSKRAGIKEIETKKQAAIDLLAKIKNGESFEALAKRFSEDKNSAKNGGDFGWLTAKLPTGFYDFENAIYDLRKGEVSEIIKTPLGWHIIKKTDTRPARGLIKVAHILKRTDQKNPTLAKKEIDRIFAELANGADFATVAKKNSDDDKTAKKGGELAPFGIKIYEGAFEEAAFGLKKDGDHTKPIKTKIGYHIIKRLEKIDLEEYPQFEAKNTASIKKDSRYETQKEKVIEDIKKRANYKLNKKVLDGFVAKQTPELYTYKWKPSVDIKDDVLFSFGDKKDYKLSAFMTFLKSNTRMRLRFDKNDPIAASVEQLYNEYVKESTLKYEQSNLEDRHPEYKSLMREYEEGILLFEASKQEVWDKASKDTLGLYTFYEQNKSKYMWLPRADVASYTVKTYAKEAKNVYKCAKKKSDKKLLEKFNKKGEILISEINRIERASKGQEGMEWKEGARSEFVYNEKKGLGTFKKILKIHKPSIKTLEEARGYVIADYQDQLEKEWVKKLSAKYKVKLMEDVVNQLIK